jgi:hypothetical protein
MQGHYASKCSDSDAVGKEKWSGGRHFEKSAHFLAESPVERAIQEYPRYRYRIEQTHAKKHPVFKISPKTSGQMCFPPPHRQ